MSIPPEPATGYDKHASQTIFPEYINAALTPRQGRRLTLAQSVMHPTLEEMVVALNHMGYRGLIVDQSRSLPASQGSDIFPVVPRGCIKVAIKSPVDAHYIKKSEFDTQTRESMVDGIDSKHQLLKRVAAYIKAQEGSRPQLKSVADIIATVPGAVPQQPRVTNKK